MKKVSKRLLGKALVIAGVLLAVIIGCARSIVAVIYGPPPSSDESNKRSSKNEQQRIEDKERNDPYRTPMTVVYGPPPTRK